MYKRQDKGKTGRVLKALVKEGRAFVEGINLVSDVYKTQVPMLCGSSSNNKGVQTLLDYVCAFLPSPLDTETVSYTHLAVHGPDKPAG